MRKRIYNWQGQRFGYIWLEGEPGQSLEKQSQGVFDRAGPELASLGLALDRNVVRSRVYGRTRDARNIVSAARGRAFSGQARAATSSFISPDRLDWYSDVALELWAMAASFRLRTVASRRSSCRSICGDAAVERSAAAGPGSGRDRAQ